MASEINCPFQLKCKFPPRNGSLIGRLVRAAVRGSGRRTTLWNLWLAESVNTVVIGVISVISVNYIVISVISVNCIVISVISIVISVIIVTSTMISMISFISIVIFVTSATSIMVYDQGSVIGLHEDCA